MIPLPTNLSNPAQRALTSAGITHLEQIAQMGEARLLKLHGLGPKTIRQLREAMQEHGLVFREDGGKSLDPPEP